MLRWWAEYRLYDRQMRIMVARGDIRDAIDFTTSYRENASNWSFDRLTKALDAVTAINRAHMDSATDAGLDGLAGRGPAAAFLALVAAVLVWAGIRPRLAQYRTGEPSARRLFRRDARSVRFAPTTAPAAGAGASNGLCPGAAVDPAATSVAPIGIGHTDRKRDAARASVTTVSVRLVRTRCRPGRRG
ncbi:hypothetical protein [Embleya sp. NPDC059259]|uniref:hypothetical protein n=1 Tax=unclassified Embleya TaxID=2699296 RepID=UPI0036C138EB